MMARHFVRLSTGVLGAAGLAVVITVGPRVDVRLWLPDLLVGWAFLVAGLVVAQRHDGRRQGLLSSAVGVAWFVADLGLGAATLYVAALVHVALAMPRGRLGTMSARAVTGLAYLAVPLSGHIAGEAVTLGLAALLLGLASVTTGPRRLLCALVGGLLGINLVAHVVAPREADPALLLAYELCLIGFAGLLPSLQASSARGSEITDLVVALGPEDALADLVRRDPKLLQDPAFPSAVAAAERIRASHAELTGHLTEQLAELAQSRKRLVSTEDSERARLEERLQRGPLGRLDRIAAHLSAVTSTDPQARIAVERARDQLRLARMDLTQIARGLYPAAVADGNLESALHDVAARSPIHVELHLDTARIEPDLAATIYFVCNEAVANAFKHSSAQRIVIVVRRAGPGMIPGVEVEVVDDGHGGARPDRGTGLRGLADRVQIAGGTFDVGDVLPGGTRVSAFLPDIIPRLSGGA